MVWIRAPPPTDSHRRLGVRCLEVSFHSGSGIGQEKLFDRFARENNQREYAKDRSERHKKAFDAGDDEREPIARAFGEGATGDQNAKGPCEAERKETRTHANKNPTQHFRRLPPS